MNVYNNAMRYFSSHVWANSIAHTAGGFGLAIILQQYFKGNTFLPLTVGVVLLALSVVIHVRSMFSYKD